MYVSMFILEFLFLYTFLYQLVGGGQSYRATLSFLKSCFWPPGKCKSSNYENIHYSHRGKHMQPVEYIANIVLNTEG